MSKFNKKENEEELFLRMSQNIGYLSKEQARDTYFALVRAIITMSRSTGKASLPDFGVFTLKKHAARRSRDVRTGEMLDLSEKNVLKFKPDVKLRAYLRLLDSQGVDTYSRPQ